MIIGMSGSRTGITRCAKMKFLNFLKENDIEEAHHGDCVGSDQEFHNIITSKKIKSVIHPPINPYKRAYCMGDLVMPEKQYLSRNKDIVNSSNILIAFPETMTEVLRSGTWSTIRYAKKMGKDVKIFYPNGTVSEI